MFVKGCCPPSTLRSPHESNRSAPDFRRPASSEPEQDDDNGTSQISPSGQQQQPQRQTTAMKEEIKEKEETPRAEEGGYVTKDESSTGSSGGGKEKTEEATGDVATAEVVVAAAAAGEVAADAAAVGANTAKGEKKEKEDVLKATSGEDPQKEKHRGSPSQLAGGAGEKTDEGAGAGGAAAPPADAGTKIEERADTMPESRVAPGEHKPTAFPQAGGDKGLVEKELPVPAGGRRPESDSSDEDDGDGFRIVVGREVAPPAAPAAPTKRFLRGENVAVWCQDGSSGGNKGIAYSIRLVSPSCVSRWTLAAGQSGTRLLRGLVTDGFATSHFSPILLVCYRCRSRCL